MTKNDFRELFVQALDGAAEQVESRLDTRIPRSFLVELHAPAASREPIGVEEALDRIYLGADRFYRIIDVAITAVLPDASVAFVRVSGHPPTAFDQTWDPAALGPFKQILAEQVADQRVHSG